MVWSVWAANGHGSMIVVYMVCYLVVLLFNTDVHSYAVLMLDSYN